MCRFLLYLQALIIILQMDLLTVISLSALGAVVAALIILIIYSGRARARLTAELLAKEEAVAAANAALKERSEDIERCKSELASARAELAGSRAELKASEQLRGAEKEHYVAALAEIKAGHEKAIEAARTAIVLENEKSLKAREETLRKEAAETMKVVAGGLDKDIREMKEAFEAQKIAHSAENASLKTKFDETVRNLRQQTETIGNTADNLARALKGQNKAQGIFGETILENILKAEGFREGYDYDSEAWLRDRRGSLIENEDSGRRMRPDFAIHFPDGTDVLIDSKVSLTALSDWFSASTDEERADASARNLESVRSHVKELSGKEYQKYVVGRKTLEYVIMFIPNYGAYQLAKQEDKDIFSKAFERNVLITTEETLIPFLRLIRSAWVQKEQMENIRGIVEAAQNMVDRVSLFCEENAKVERGLETVLKNFKQNSARLVTSDRSIVGAAWKAVKHGVRQPSGHILPPVAQELPGQNGENPGAPELLSSEN